MAEWEPQKNRKRGELERMLWHDLALPSTPPPAPITHRQEYPAYVVENIVLETAPNL